MAPLTVEQIPDALRASLPARPHLYYPPQGMTSDVAIAEGDGRAVVRKRCANPIYVPWLRREHAVLRAIEGVGLPVPVVIDYVEAETEVWLALSRLPGRSLWSALLEGGDRASLLHRLGQLLRRLHATPIPLAFRKHPDWIARKLSDARTNLAWCDGNEALLRTLEETRPAVTPDLTTKKCWRSTKVTDAHP